MPWLNYVKIMPICTKPAIMTPVLTQTPIDIAASSPTAYSFEKRHRLLTPADFKAVFDSPIKKVHTPHLLAFIAQNQGIASRLGLAITKKKLKKAVDRNRLKRLCRENFRHHHASWMAIDVVVIVKVGYPREFDIATEVAELFNKINKLYSDKSAD